MSIEDQLSEAAESLSYFISDYAKVLEKKGFCVEEIVALDLDKEAVVFYMTSGDIVRVRRDSVYFEELPEEHLN